MWWVSVVGVHITQTSECKAGAFVSKYALKACTQGLSKVQRIACVVGQGRGACKTGGCEYHGTPCCGYAGMLVHDHELQVRACGYCFGACGPG